MGLLKLKSVFLFILLFGVTLQAAEPLIEIDDLVSPPTCTEIINSQVETNSVTLVTEPALSIEIQYSIEELEGLIKSYKEQRAKLLRRLWRENNRLVAMATARDDLRTINSAAIPGANERIRRQKAFIESLTVRTENAVQIIDEVISNIEQEIQHQSAD